MKSVQLPRYEGVVEVLAVEGCSVVVVGSRLTEGVDTDNVIWSAIVVAGSADTDGVIWSIWTASIVVERLETLDVLVDKSRKK